jgi:hypothetical protein
VALQYAAKFRNRTVLLIVKSNISRKKIIKSSRDISRVSKIKLADVSGTISVPILRASELTASPSPSHITVDGQSTSPSGAHDQILLMSQV